MEGKYLDLHVVDGDMVLDAAAAPEIVSDRYSIGQDIKHRLIEAGLVRKLVAERDPVVIGTIKNEMIIEAEKDLRLSPGSVQVTELESNPGTHFLTARTLEYGEIYFPF